LLSDCFLFSETASQPQVGSRCPNLTYCTT
jgi:hypothetical protein